jgi:hypothetical protein
MTETWKRFVRGTLLLYKLTTRFIEHAKQNNVSIDVDNQQDHFLTALGMAVGTAFGDVPEAQMKKGPKSAT